MMREFADSLDKKREIDQQLSLFAAMKEDAKIMADVKQLPEEVEDFSGKIDGHGIKNSMFQSYREKPPLALVPRALLYAAGRALGYGAAKYAPNNWRRGMKWTEPASALLRHMTAWLEGEDLDPVESGGSGLSHLDHAVACLAFLTHMVNDERYSHFDDRPVQ